MIVEKYSIECDICEDGSSYSFSTLKEAEKFLEKEFGWLIVKGQHICPKCVLKKVKPLIEKKILQLPHN